MKVYAVFIDYGDGPVVEEDRIFLEKYAAHVSLATMDDWDKEHGEVKELEVK
jgi:hypothetical protein